MELMIKQTRVVPYQGGVCSELSLQHREVPAVAHPNGGRSQWWVAGRYVGVAGLPPLTDRTPRWV